MSAGELAATLAVAFVGGAGGAILGPWVQHTFPTRTRREVDRIGPYEEVLAAAPKLRDTAAEPSGERREVAIATCHEADRGLVQAVDDADRVASDPIRSATNALRDAARAAIREWHDTDWPDPDDDADAYEAALETGSDAAKRTRDAYRALRDQAQRETNA